MLDKLLMKNFILPLCIFTILGLTAACNSSANKPIENSMAPETTSELSSDSKRIIQEYNSIILEFSNVDDETKTLQKLKFIIPKLKKINSDKERNSLLISSYLRLGDIDQAYKLTQKILTKESKPNLKNFQCMLMESLKKPASLIKNCYFETALLYKNELNKLDPSASTYTQMLWGFNVNMYHAGNANSVENLKKIIHDQKNENDKLMYETWFELETNTSERQDLLNSIASRM